jgi:hypothetical protein
MLTRAHILSNSGFNRRAFQKLFKFLTENYILGFSMSVGVYELKKGSSLALIFIMLLPIVFLPVSQAVAIDLSYDDGTAESSYAPTLSLYTYAVRFHPPTSETYQLAKVKYYIDGNPAPFKVDIRDSNIQPLYSANVTPTGTGWFVVDLGLQGISVHGDFWVGIRYLTLYAPRLGADTSHPDGESAEGQSGIPSSPNISSLDWMIRATVATTITYCSLSLRSRLDSGSADTNLGQIKLDGTPHNLPSDLSVQDGDYTVEYVPVPGYAFVSWETTGGINVSSSIANSSSLTVSSPGGTLRAVYKSLPVGGESVSMRMQVMSPINAVQLIAPWIALALIAAATAVAGYRRFLKKRW